MTDPLDLLAVLREKRWRLDMDRRDATFGNYRCMWYCAECGVWRCVEEAGTYYADPKEAIRRAIAAAEA